MSKFALDGFGKAISAELGHRGIEVLHVYPAYIKTDIVKNALAGTQGQTFGVDDCNIESGMTVQYAVDILIKAMYLKRNQVTIGSFFYYILPKLCFLSESFTNLVGEINNKQ